MGASAASAAGAGATELGVTDVTRLDRRVLLRLSVTVIATLGAFGHEVGFPDEYPARPVQIVVPFPAGGSADNRARQFAQALSERLGARFLVVNKPGASGTLGIRQVAGSAPDGYTIGLANNAVLAVAPNVQKDPGFDPLRDLAPITLVAMAQAVFVVRPTLRVNSIKEFIALAKTHPGTLTYASSGIGSINHLPIQMFARMTGVELLHVPYRGEAEFMLDLLGDRIDMTFTSMTGTLPYIKAGKLKALAVGSTKRSPVLPDVPTISEAGVPGFEWHNWFSFVAPAGTPAPIIGKLNREIAAILFSARFQQDYLNLGYEVVASSPEELSAWIKRDLERYGKLVNEFAIDKQ